MKRKTLLAIISCALAFIISAGATYAWLIARDGTVNIFILGENDAELIEIFEPPAELAPNITFRKEPVVYNTGNFPAFARARVEFSNLEGAAISELRHGPGGTLEGIHPAWHECDCGCGYFYYTNILQPTDAFIEPEPIQGTYPQQWVGYPWVGQPSAPLFTHVHILENCATTGVPLELVNMVDFDIIIYVETRIHLDNYPTCEVGFTAGASCTCPGNRWRTIWE